MEKIKLGMDFTCFVDNTQYSCVIDKTQEKILLIDINNDCVGIREVKNTFFRKRVYKF